MSIESDLSALLRRVLSQPRDGIVGLVEDVLKVCRERELQLDWQADRCRVRSRSGDWEEMSMPLPRTVFRAMLARLAVLCNEHAPNAISPYGGHGELSVGGASPAVFRVAFTNTAAEQKLELALKATATGASPSDKELSKAVSGD